MLEHLHATPTQGSGARTTRRRGEEKLQSMAAAAPTGTNRSNHRLPAVCAKKKSQLLCRTPKSTLVMLVRNYPICRLHTKHTPGSHTYTRTHTDTQPRALSWMHAAAGGGRPSRGIPPTRSLSPPSLRPLDLVLVTSSYQTARQGKRRKGVRPSIVKPPSLLSQTNDPVRLLSDARVYPRNSWCRH